MALLFTKPDDTALTGIAFTAERGVPSAVQAVKIKNDGIVAVSGAYVTLYAETTPASGDYVTSGNPVVDERMGRFQTTSVDSSGTVGQTSGNTAEQVMGANAVALLPPILPGNSIFADVWLEQASSSASGGTVNAKVEIANAAVALPLPLGVSEVATGVLTEVGSPYSLLVSGRITTATGTPDDEVHTAAGSWLLIGTAYTDATIRDTAFNQNDSAAEALTAGQSYIAALTQSSANQPTVTKGLRATTPVKPTPAAGEVLLAWITVNYSAGATVIATADIENVNDYGRLLVTAPVSGLSATVYPGRAISSDFMQIHPVTETTSLTASVTNRIWLDVAGQVVVTTSATPPSAGAHLLATAATDGSAVTSLVDLRTFVGGTGGAAPAHASSHATAGSDSVSAASIGAATTSHTHAEADVTSLVADLAAKAALASPTFTGAPLVPTATLTDSSTKAASTAFVKGQSYLRADGTTLPTAALSMDNHKITSLSTPTADQDAVTKAYADAIAAGAVADDSITFAKIQNILSGKLLGRATAATGDTEEITLGTNLSFTGTTLNAAGGGSGHTVKEAGGAMTARTGLNFLAGFDLADDAGGDETEVALDLSEVSGGGDLSYTGNVPTIPNDTVTFAKMQDIATAKLLGRATAATGNVEEITLGTNLSYTGTTLNAAGGGGMTAQDQIDMVWLKKFFSDASVLPATERIAASLATFPTEAGVATGSFTKDVGHARFGTAPTTAYWDLGALRSEVLVVATLQLGEGIQTAIAVSSGVPASEYPDGYYFWQDSGGFKIDKRVSGSGTTLGSIPAGLQLGANTTDVKQPIGMALYYNDTTGVLKAFVRASSGSWFQVVSTTDSTFTTVRYVSMTWSKSGGGSFTGRVILPFAAWSE